MTSAIVMSIIFSAIPLLMLIIIGLAAFSKTRISLDKTRLVVGLYLALLLACVPVFYAIAEPGAPRPMLKPGQMAGIYESFQISEFYDALHEGWLNEYEGKEVITQWNFDYPEERLEITDLDDHPYQRYYTFIVVDRKEARDGQLEVLIYVPKSPLDPRPTLANPPEIRLHGNQLQIIRPDKLDLEEVMFYQDFTIAQFTGMGVYRPVTDYFFLDANPLIYLRIPENLRIDTDESTEHIIRFINE